MITGTIQPNGQVTGVVNEFQTLTSYLSPEQEVTGEISGSHDLTGELSQTEGLTCEMTEEGALEGSLSASYGTKGLDGGYYIPSVTDGELTWEASKAGMPPIPSAHISGKDGKDGQDGKDGKDGYTPQKNVDYFDGKDGSDGKDGVSVEHSWDGTTLTITSASGTTSSDLRGEKGDRGEAGYTPQKGIDYFDGKDGKDGKDGVSGKDGYTPIKGVDYFDGLDGRDGIDGKDGVDGYTPVKGIDYFDGKDGKDGYTPVKGIDYFTAEEIEELAFSIVDGVLFTDVSYVQGDNKAYILTDYIPNSNTRIVGRLYFNATTTTRCVFGARTSTSSNRLDFGNNSSSKYNFGWGTSATSSSLAELDDVFDFEINRNTLYINGEEAIVRDDKEFMCEYPLAIFGCNTKGSVTPLAPSGTKIEWLKIYEGETLMCDFVARKHLVDGYGLYDRVAKKFFPNVAGTGTFTGA